MPNFIDKETYQLAAQKLPNIDLLKRKIIFLDPDWISLKFKSDSNFPVASVCFQDANRTLSESWYALLESFAHKIWFFEKSAPPDEITGIFFARYYADDVALRLYSAAEHLAKAIVYILNVDDESIKKNRAGSRFGSVRKFLAENESSHIISQTIEKLYLSDNWKKTIAYRDSWVHNQPPIIDGLGTVFQRKRRWHKTEDNMSTLGIGAGDEAQYSIDDLLDIIHPALKDYAEALNVTVDFYIQELEKTGIILTENGMQVSLIKKSRAG